MLDLWFLTMWLTVAGQREMNLVTVCPNTLEKVNNASERLKCGNDLFGKNQYLCLPNVEKSSLFEFCHDEIMGINEKGNCLEVNPFDRTLLTESCTDFPSGCPENHYWSHQFYMYPACQDINPGKHCYTSQPSCTIVVDVDDGSDFNYILILVIVSTFLLLLPFLLLYVNWIKRRRNSAECVLSTWKAKKYDTEQKSEVIPIYILQETETCSLEETTELPKKQNDVNSVLQDFVQTRHRHPDSKSLDGTEQPFKEMSENLPKRRSWSFSNYGGIQTAVTNQD